MHWSIVLVRYFVSNRQSWGRTGNLWNQLSGLCEWAVETSMLLGQKIERMNQRKFNVENCWSAAKLLLNRNFFYHQQKSYCSEEILLLTNKFFCDQQNTFFIISCYQSCKIWKNLPIKSKLMSKMENFNKNSTTKNLVKNLHKLRYQIWVSLFEMNVVKLVLAERLWCVDLFTIIFFVSYNLLMSLF